MSAWMNRESLVRSEEGVGVGRVASEPTLPSLRESALDGND